MLGNAKGASRTASNADHPAASSRGSHLLELAMELSIGLFGSSELALGIAECLIELRPQMEARINHGTRITRIIPIKYGTRITRIRISHLADSRSGSPAGVAARLLR
jgi:hypothetical protein